MRLADTLRIHTRKAKSSANTLHDGKKRSKGRRDFIRMRRREENASFHKFAEIKSSFSKKKGENRFLSFGCLKEEGESFFLQIPPAFFALLRNCAWRAVFRFMRERKHLKGGRRMLESPR